MKINDYKILSMKNFFQVFMKVESDEVKATLLSFLFVFILMAAYYILRPVRDAMASDWSDAEVSFLWTLNFIISIAVVFLYGIIVSHVRFKYLVPGVYLFFASTFFAFFVAIKSTLSPVMISKSFYVWVSVFSLFHISVFWSYMADFFNKDQAKRLFAIIASGASAGAIVGPSVPALLAGKLGTDTLMLLAAIMLIVPVPIVMYLAGLKRKGSLGKDGDMKDQYKEGAMSSRIGGNPLSGFKEFLKNPYLLSIGAFILLYTMIGSFVYFEQKNLLAPFDMVARTRILGSIDWIVNVLTFTLAFFATGRLVNRFGMAVTLPLLPVLIVAGMLILAFVPVLIVLLALQVARRAGNYAVTRPAREMLFTDISREARFKAKPVIDIVVYRGGDTVTAWLFAGLTQGLGLGMASVALVGAGIAAVWAALGVYLGKWFDCRKSVGVIVEDKAKISGASL